MLNETFSVIFKHRDPFELALCMQSFNKIGQGHSGEIQIGQTHRHTIFRNIIWRVLEDTCPLCIEMSWCKKRDQKWNDRNGLLFETNLDDWEKWRIQWWVEVKCRLHRLDRRQPNLCPYSLCSLHSLQDCFYYPRFSLEQWVDIKHRLQGLLHNLT